MGNNVKWGKWLGVVLLVFSNPACHKPQLRSDQSKEAAEEIVEGSDAYYREIRKGVIGQTFETLTLGAKQFTDAEIREITDRVIVIGHAGGVERVSWDDVTDEVREKWGYNPNVESLADRIKTMLPDDDDPPENKVAAKAGLPESDKKSDSQIDMQERANEIARKEKMLEAQLVGIRSLESDLARHSAPLNELRRQLQAIRAQQSRKRSGGIMVERVNGKSTVVDRRREAGEIESKLKVEEQLVAQLTKSIQTARAKYQEIKREVDQLRRE